MIAAEIPQRQSSSSWVGRADDNLAHKEIRAVFPGEFALTIALTGWPNCNYVIIYVWYKV